MGIEVCKTGIIQKPSFLKGYDHLFPLCFAGAQNDQFPLNFLGATFLVTAEMFCFLQQLFDLGSVHGSTFLGFE